jgi:hypothetical protein
MATTHIMKEAIWLLTLLANMKETQTHSTISYYDNQSAIAFTLNPKYHTHTKQIEIYYHPLKKK